MRRHTSAAAVVSLFLISEFAWGGLISDTVSKVPSRLATPLGPQSGDPVTKLTYISCYDVSTGALQDCGFDITITGLTQPDSDVANNGGHTHDLGTHPQGNLKIIYPNQTGASSSLAGQTSFNLVIVSHAIPDVSGKIDTVLNLRVPPGWHTVFPESCDATQTSWCFKTTIDVGVSGLTSLPDGSPFYAKLRNPPPPASDSAHTNAVAFFGTADTVFYLTAIAELFNELSGNVLSVNDMSLIKGGLFDWQARLGQNIYSPPHSWHRTGQSADINAVSGGNCFNNFDLLMAVNLIMPADGISFFENRQFPSAGRFLCESTGNIHIDFDMVPPASPFQ